HFDLDPHGVFSDASSVIQFAESYLERAYRGEILPGTEIPLTLQTADGRRVSGRIHCLAANDVADGVEVGPTSPGGRVVLRVEFREWIGQEGIIEAPDGEGITVSRISGGRRDTVRLVDGERPWTRVMHIIGGPYGSTGNFGLYTVYTGR